MATFRNRGGKWQARVQTKGHVALSKTFINKIDAERWAKQIEVEMQKGSYTNLVLAERTTFIEIIERYIVEVLPTMRGGKAICQFYGGKSMGPRTKEGKNCIRAAHWKHGEESQISKAERSAKSVMFRYLTDIGNHVNLFYTQLKTQGRPPSGYTQLNLTDPEQLVLAILKTQSSK
jgi:hypothetical protein